MSQKSLGHPHAGGVNIKTTNFIKDKVPVFITNLMGMILLSVFLFAIKNGMGEIILILFVWFLLLTAYLFVEFRVRKSYFSKLLQAFEALDQKYLISEVMDKPYCFDDLVFYSILKSSNKSMLEHIMEIKHERREYKEYVESWVHEIKTPISAMKLLCENNKSDTTRKLLAELQKTENFVEQALFYARSENVEKDYFIKEVELSQCINHIIVRNKLLLIQNEIGIKIDHCENTVYTDSKWLEFILNQIVMNAIKYKREQNPVIRFDARPIKNGIALSIEDNGVGIEKSELARVFEKGFTGTNGRKQDKSTGIGLYLCKRLCDKLGLEISVDSEINNFTRITIFFPKGTFLSLL